MRMSVGRMEATMIVRSQSRIYEKPVSTGCPDDFGKRFRQPFLISGQRRTSVPEAAKFLDRRTVLAEHLPTLGHTAADSPAFPDDQTFHVKQYMTACSLCRPDAAAQGIRATKILR